MLTTERELRSRNERYGAFESDVEKMKNKIGFVEERELAQSFDSIRSVEPATNADFNANTATKYGAIIKPATKRLNVSDAYVDRVKAEKNVKAGVPSRAKVSVKNALMITAYVLVVVALIAVIVMNATAISTVSEMNAGLETDILSLEGAKVAAGEELAALNSEARIAELAISDLGLTEGSATTVQMNVPGYNAPRLFTPTTNWFDELCDFIGKII